MVLFRAGEEQPATGAGEEQPEIGYLLLTFTALQQLSPSELKEALKQEQSPFEGNAVSQYETHKAFGVKMNKYKPKTNTLKDLSMGD